MNPSNTLRSVLKMGTRRSLLALAQSGWVAREIEQANPGVRVEVVGIDTRGDKILDVPLTSVQGKEFFVAELDDALRSGRVDFTVHSMKDLSLDRPEDFCLAAVPVRENLRDIVLFGPSILEKLGRDEEILIGTSSPRRLENLPTFLTEALPRLGQQAPRLKFVEIRGNVNTRLSRVHEPQGSERYLDGVVLALAGLNRLMVDENGARELKQLLQGTRLMVMPITECPAAAAQGALAVESRKDDSFVRQCLAKIHHEPSQKAAATERAILAEWGGGCHQRFGASAVVHPELGSVLYIKGRKPTGEAAHEIRWQGPKLDRARFWDGTRYRSATATVSSDLDRHALQKFADAKAGDFVFVAHHRALVGEDGQVSSGWRTSLFSKRVWVSGTASWYRLARAGLWVEGCAEGLGAEFALPEWWASRALQLPSWERAWVLTHESQTEAELDGWKKISPEQRLATYSVSREKLNPQAAQEIGEARHVFWASGSQWEVYGATTRRDAIHACGPGKTAQFLRKKGLRPLVFPHVDEWRKALGMKGESI
jgi:hydroxymethylbilane synthase